MNSLLRIFLNLCRLVLSVTLILSGFVKAIDPRGTQYKIQDYLTALGLEGLLPDWTTLSLSVALSAAEFCLGIFLLFAMHRRMLRHKSPLFRRGRGRFMANSTPRSSPIHPLVVVGQCRRRGRPQIQPHRICTCRHRRS